MRRQRDDDGVTLIEILLTVMFLGSAVTAILGGMASSLLFSDVNNKMATAETYVRNVAEDLKTYDPDTGNPPDAYEECWSGTGYSAGPLKPDGFGEPTLQVEVWDAATGTFVAPGELTTCQGGSPADQGLQRITITVSSDNGRVQNRQLQTVKRRP